MQSFEFQHQKNLTHTKERNQITSLTSKLDADFLYAFEQFLVG